MKYNCIYTLLFLISITFFSTIKSEESIYSSFDLDFKSIDDNILNSFKDFEFGKDKQDTLNIKQKMKKVACLNIITTAIKESKSDIKHQLKKAKEENKNNFNKFISNMTETCIKIIKEKDIDQIFNHQNFEIKRFPLGKEDIEFKKHLELFLQENENFKKMEEIELERQKRNKMIINSIILGVIASMIFIFFYVIRKRKKLSDMDDKKGKDEKKSGHKKKGKNSEKKDI